MSHSDEAIALMRAVLRDNCTTDLAARRHLNIAEQERVDPLEYCAHRFGLGNAEVWRRAAGWAGLQFAGETPSRPPPAPAILRLEHLGEVRTLRQMVLGENVQFIAPRFSQVLALREAGADLKRHVRITSPEAIEAGVTRAASEQLMDEARQRMTRLWPRASASQDLPKRVRVAFVALLAALIGLVMISGYVGRPVLIPIVAALLMAPGVLRLLAAIPRRDKAPTVRLLTDAELPVYSVLIPLRDEAAMVPMLKRAMTALGYPALCIKRTSGRLVRLLIAILTDLIDKPIS